MNKKFSTLAVGLLLAGAFVNDASAIKVKDAVAGKYYHILRIAQYQNGGTWSTGADFLSNTQWLHQDDNGAYLTSTKAGDDALWKVTKSTVEGVDVFTFTNKAGKTLTYTDGLASQTKFSVTNQDAYGTDFSALPDGSDANVVSLSTSGVQIQPQMAYAGADDRNVMTFADYTTSTASNFTVAFDLVEPTGVAMTADELNAINGATAGFKMQIGDIKDNAFVTYSALEGQVFDGNLTASTTSIGVTTTPAEGYFLKNGDKYIVLLKERWSAYNTNHAGEDMGYKFTLMSKDDLKTQLQRDAAGGADAASPKILTVKFQISKNVNDGDYLEVAALTSATRYELYVADFNGTKYLTVNKSTTDYDAEFNTSASKTYVKFGAGQLVDMKKFIVKDSYYTIVRNEDEAVLGPNCSNSAWLGADQVQLDMPEGMWAISYTGSGNAKFKNRESGKEASFVIDPAKFYYVEGEEDVYEYEGKKYTIKTHAIEDLAAGYADFGKTSQKSYTIGVYSPVWKGVAYLAENHAGKHQIGLDTDAANATAWRLEPQVETRKVSPITDDVTTETDSVYVISKLSYWGKKDNVDQWLSTDDTLKIVSYTIKNAATGEYVGYNSTSKYYECKNTPIRFAFKKVGETYNMVEVKAQNTTTPAKLNNKKVYGGDSATDGLLNRVSCMYERTENDLFKVEIADAAIYRRLDAELDTISIFRDENASQLLYEDGIFLGLKNENQFDIAPAMLADAAYAPEDTDRPQYMLVLNPTIVPAGTYCPIHGVDATCEHSQDTPGWIEGRYLVNLKDTALAFAAKPENLHKVNPYVNTEGLYRLGFVPATHKEDYLAIAAVKPTAADTITVGKEDYNVAKFAFKYVDREAGSFVIETANYNTVNGTREGEGYVKWMNGVVVVVPTEANADVFNLNADEDRNPTSNESVAASEVSVVAVNGAIIVKGAAGKVVTVANILGQTIANQVAASDNVTIAAPAGVAVVTVDGQATKVIVK